MSWIAAAVAVGGAVMGARSAKKGANAMADSADASAQVQREIFQQQRSDLAPYRAVGGQALNAYAAAMGLPGHSPGAGKFEPREGRVNESLLTSIYREVLGRDPDPGARAYIGQDAASVMADIRSSPEYQQKFQAGKLPGRELGQEFMGGSATNPDDRYGGFYASPGYQFRMDEGAKGLDRNMAARGLLNSGARGKAMTRYAQGVASDEFGNYMNRLAGAAGIGQTAVNSGNQAAGQYGANMGNAMNQKGMARASGYLAQGNAMQSLANNYLAYRGMRDQ